jgi:hypothetical protein
MPIVEFHKTKKEAENVPFYPESFKFHGVYQTKSGDWAAWRTNVKSQAKKYSQEKGIYGKKEKVSELSKKQQAKRKFFSKLRKMS